MVLKDSMAGGLIALALGAMAVATMSPAEAQYIRRDGFYGQGFGTGYIYSGIGIGRTAFPIPGAIPVGTPYDPYRLPYSYSWPYGYGFPSR
jgi:hypothetical protein